MSDREKWHTPPPTTAEDKKHDETMPEEVARRQFLTQAGKAGVGTGLASFLLVGGVMKSAIAADTDNCKPPCDSSAGDICNKAGGNDDVCDAGGFDLNTNTPGYEHGGDECGEGETDECPKFNSSHYVAGDQCDPDSDIYGADNCTNHRVDVA